MAIVIGFLTPFFGTLKPLMTPLLMLLLYCSFMKLKWNMSNFFRKELLLFPLMCWVLLPGITFYLTRFLGPELQVGLLLVVITPPALASPVMVSLVKGDLEFCLTNVALFNLLSPLMYVIIPKIYLSGSDIALDYWGIFWKVCLYIFIPLTLAMVTRLNKGITYMVNQFIDPYKILVQLLLVMIAVSSSAARVKSQPVHLIVLLFVAVYAVTAALYMVAWFVGKKRNNLQYTLPFTTGHKNTLLSINIGLASFSPLAALPAVFYLITHHTFNGIVLWLWNNQQKRTNKR